MDRIARNASHNVSAFQKLDNNSLRSRQFGREPKKQGKAHEKEHGAALPLKAKNAEQEKIVKLEKVKQMIEEKKKDKEKRKAEEERVRAERMKRAEQRKRQGAKEDRER